MGGFDQIASKRTVGGTRSGDVARTFVRPSSAAFDRHRSTARSLTSTAQTVAPGERRASVSAIGPAPQPRSSRLPVAGGGGAFSSSSFVPASTAPWLNVPRSVVKRMVASASASVTCRGALGTVGRWSK